MTDTASAALDPVTLETVNRLHDLTTRLHVPIYFAREAGDEYAKEGVGGEGPKAMGGYFGSRTAAMGELPAGMVVATFYNWSPDVVVPAMEGLWDVSNAEAMQLARWRLADVIFNSVGRDDAWPVAEANAALQNVVDNLPWGGRPMAAGNYDVLGLLDRSPYADDALIRLWQLATIVREWRGDAHIGLLISEPLSPAECTAVTNAQYGGFVKASRGWSDKAWDTAVSGLVERGWLSDEDTLTEHGSSQRAVLEQRTNELSAAMWEGMTDTEVNHLGDLIEPVVDAIIDSGRLKPIGVRPRNE